MLLDIHLLKLFPLPDPNCRLNLNLNLMLNLHRSPSCTAGGRSSERARVIVDDRYDELPPQRVYSGRGGGAGYPYEGGGGGRGAVRYVEDEYYDDGYTEPVAPVRCD